MMRKFVLPLILIAALLLSACNGSAPAARPEGPALQIELRTNPNPPAAGDVELNLTVMDANGVPVNGAEVILIADHIDMSGMTMQGAAVEQGDGVYSVRTNFSMSGNWKITAQVRKGELNYSQDIPVKIQ